MNIYSPNDDIMKCGEKVRGAILVARGEVEVLRGAVVEQRMQRRDHFAQECLFLERAAEHDVRSKGFSEVLLLPRTEFQRIVRSQCDAERLRQLEESARGVSKQARAKANKMFGSGEDLTPTTGFRRHCHPHGFFRKAWDCAVLTGLVFYAFSLPLSFMHLVENASISDTPVLLGLGYATDFFFVLNGKPPWNPPFPCPIGPWHSRLSFRHQSFWSGIIFSTSTAALWFLTTRRFVSTSTSSTTLQEN